MGYTFCDIWNINVNIVYNKSGIGKLLQYYLIIILWRIEWTRI